MSFPDLYIATCTFKTVLSKAFSKPFNVRVEKDPLRAGNIVGVIRATACLPAHLDQDRTCNRVFQAGSLPVESVFGNRKWEIAYADINVDPRRLHSRSCDSTHPFRKSRVWSSTLDMGGRGKSH